MGRLRTSVYSGDLSLFNITKIPRRSPNSAAKEDGFPRGLKMFWTAAYLQHRGFPINFIRIWLDISFPKRLFKFGRKISFTSQMPDINGTHDVGNIPFPLSSFSIPLLEAELGFRCSGACAPDYPRFHRNPLIRGHWAVRVTIALA
jgi:hypothetical protein